MPADAEEGVEVVQGLQCGLVKVTVQPEPPGLQRKETQPLGDLWVGRPEEGERPLADGHHRPEDGERVAPRGVEQPALRESGLAVGRRRGLMGV